MKDFKKQIDKHVEDMIEKNTLKIEYQIRMCIRPRPKWIPELIHRRLVKQLLQIEYTPGNFSRV